MNLTPHVQEFFSSASLYKLLSEASAVITGTPEVLPAAWTTPSTTIRPVGTQVGYYSATGNRQAARGNAVGSPSRAVTNLPGREFRTVTGFVSNEHFSVDYNLLVGMNAGLPWFAEQATRQLQFDMTQFMSRQSIRNNDCVYGVLRSGKIIEDADGTIISQAAFDALSGGDQAKCRTVDMSAGAANTLTTNGSGGTYNIGTWSNTSFDISGALRKLRQTSIQRNNYRLADIYYGVNIPSYLSTNSTLKDYFKERPASLENILQQNEIPNGTLGFNWIPVYEAYTGTNQAAWFEDNFIAVAPPVSTQWYEYVPLGNLVPRVGIANGLVAGSTDAASMGVEVKWGRYSYAYHTTDPIGLKIVVGDGVLPVVKVPGVVYRGVCA
jgi:hypothetical protein